MGKLLYRTSSGAKHMEGIDILTVIQVALCTVLLSQPALQRLDSFFSWALIFIHHLCVDGRDVYIAARC